MERGGEMPKMTNQEKEKAQHPGTDACLAGLGDATRATAKAIYRSREGSACGIKRFGKAGSFACIQFRACGIDCSGAHLQMRRGADTDTDRILFPKRKMTRMKRTGYRNPSSGKGGLIEEEEA